jgi:hypothetical protein
VVSFRVLSLIVLTMSCGGRVDEAPATDAAVVSDTGVASDTAMDTRIADAIADARDKRWPITEKEAECMGLTRPMCAGCHYRDGTWYLMPIDGPPPPPDVTVDPDSYERCGLKPPGP